jgi:mannonate dehydratase
MEQLLPAARETGIRLAFHPNDPPLPVYRGVEQLFTTVDAQQELLDRYNEPLLGLTYCCGTMHESGGDVIEGIRRYGSQGKIFNVHFRNVKGRIPKFQEVFQDDGDYDSVEVMSALHEVGYEGYVMADHLPGLAADMARPNVFLLHGMPTGSRDVAHGWCVGYLRALVQATALRNKS